MQGGGNKTRAPYLEAIKILCPHASYALLLFSHDILLIQGPGGHPLFPNEKNESFSFTSVPHRVTSLPTTSGKPARSSIKE